MHQFEVYGRTSEGRYVRMVVGAIDSCSAARIVAEMFGGGFEGRIRQEGRSSLLTPV